MRKNYGLPYMGSKNKLAEEIVNFLPQKKVLVDLFGGAGLAYVFLYLTNYTINNGKYYVMQDYGRMINLYVVLFLQTLKIPSL